MKNVPIYRQGDVLIRQVKEIPAGAKPVDWSSEGRVVLAYGEVTGHAHMLGLSFASMFATDAGQRFITVKEGAELKHEEHAAITPEPGIYEVIQQVEYTPQAVRNVAD
jgi:hypothetical protein